MKKVTVGKYNPTKFNNLTKLDLYDLWFRQSLTDKTIGKLYGVTAKEVKEKRKIMGLNWKNCIGLAFKGGEQYKLEGKIRIKIK